MALQPDAHLAPEIVPSLALDVMEQGGTSSWDVDLTGPYDHKRSKFLHVTCMSRGGSFSVHLRHASNKAAGSDNVGAGKIFFRIYSFSVSAKERREACARCSRGMEQYDKACLWNHGLSPGICM